MRRFRRGARDIPWPMWLIFTGLLGFVAWWHWNYRCVEGHYETVMRTDCHQIGQMMSCNTYPSMNYVCDQWEER